MSSDKRLLIGGMSVALAIVWTLAAVGSPNGFRDLLRFLGPAILVSIALVWVVFTFAGSVFTWSRALRGIVVGTAVMAPVLAWFFRASKDPNLTSKFLFIIALAWAASLGGTLWKLAGSAHDAFKEWRAVRRMNRARKLYVPV